MSKSIRPHAPGCVFHITARTQGEKPWFTDHLKERVNDEIASAARMTGMLLLGRVVMSNHFHIVVRQNSQPLCHMMHRVMHRSAMMLKHAHRLQGHVFERRYWSGVCDTPLYIRRAIVYTHLNPWRAKLCNDPAAYRWSSHVHYLKDNGVDDAVGRRDGLRFFATSSDDDGVEQYKQHVQFQMDVDRYLRGELHANHLLAPPACDAGDRHWDETCRVALATAVRISAKRPIYDVACKLLEQLDPLCSLDLLRSGLRAPKLVILRRHLIAALLTAGYRGTQIGRLLGTSTSAVSRIAVSLRT